MKFLEAVEKLFEGEIESAWMSFEGAKLIMRVSKFGTLEIENTKTFDSDFHPVHRDMHEADWTPMYDALQRPIMDGVAYYSPSGVYEFKDRTIENILKWVINDDNHLLTITEFDETGMPTVVWKDGELV